MGIGRAYLVVGLFLGDEGKGGVVDYLAATRPVHTVVRYNGGAQAAHNVVLADGRHHTFHQFGSGTLRGVDTFLSRFMLVEPIRLLAEADRLRRLGMPFPLRWLAVDARALVTTPFHAEVNRLKERARGDGRHGSTGIGIGETRAYQIAHRGDALFVGDLRDERILRAKLRLVAERLVEVARRYEPAATIDDAAFEETIEAYRGFADRVEIVGPEYLADLLRARTGDVVFEGAQGVLLDETYGFQPHVTWTDTTLANATTLLDEAGFAGERFRLGVLRPYATRHGAGPLPTEDPALAEVVDEPHNIGYEWAGPMRFGHFDLPATRYALEVTGGVDGLAITRVDDVPRLPAPRLCVAYRDADGVRTRLPVPARPVDLDAQARWAAGLAHVATVCEAVGPDALIDRIAADLSLPIVLTSAGPTAEDKADDRLPAPDLQPIVRMGYAPWDARDGSRRRFPANRPALPHADLLEVASRTTRPYRWQPSGAGVHRGEAARTYRLGRGCRAMREAGRRSATRATHPAHTRAGAERADSSQRQPLTQPATSPLGTVLLPGEAATAFRALAASHPPSRAALLAIQRLAGNQAALAHLSRVAADRQPVEAMRARDAVVQRKIGFEFEADAWHSWRQTRPFSKQEKKQSASDRRIPPRTAADTDIAYEPLVKAATLASGPGFELQADESKVNDVLGRQETDLEFVTEPFDETPSGLKQLAKTMDAIEKMAGRISGLALRNKTANFNWNDELKSVGIRRPDILLSDGDRPLMVKMQATAGLRLDQVAALMTELGSTQPGESPDSQQRRTSGRELMTQHTVMGSKEGAGMKLFGSAPVDATRAIGALVDKYGKPASASYIARLKPAFDHFGETDSLKGIVSLLVTYLTLGDRTDYPSYPKAIAPLMARTDFARLFRMLPEPQKIVFREDDSALWYELIADASNLDLDKQVFARPTDFTIDLTRRAWIGGIARGTDYFTEKGYAAMQQTKHPQLGQLPLGTADAHLYKKLEDATWLESLGGYGAKTEKSGAAEAAIFELRAIPDMFEYTKLKDIALKLAAYADSLNQQKGKAFGEA